LLLYTDSGEPEAQRKIVLLFGSGLIGSSLDARLRRIGYQLADRLPYAWRDRSQRARNAGSLRRKVTRLPGAGKAEIHLVWCAGSGSFASRADDLADEKLAFADTLELFRDFSGSNRSVFHFTSSAGGLFEGQVLVDKESAPRPARPYGEMKLRQEQQLLELSAGPHARVRIYRPSTVFGVHRFKDRAGLVSHLLWNALRNFPTTLEANVHALRDYVYVNDVAKYMAGMLERNSGAASLVEHLVSGRPTSIREIVTIVERMLGRSLLIQYSDKMNNNADITFRSGLMPPGWKPGGLEQGLRDALRITRIRYLEDTDIQIRLGRSW